MNCTEIAERLPWFLNGSLDPREKDEIEGHLAGCTDCRRELEELRRAAEIYRAELPAEALTDYVLGTTTSGFDPTLVARRIESEPRYQEEVALLRRSLADFEATPAGAASPNGGKVLFGRFGRKVEVPRWLPIAASIAGLLLPALLVWNQTLRSDLTATVAEYRRTEQGRDAEHRAAVEQLTARVREAESKATGNAASAAELDRLQLELERLRTARPVPTRLAEGVPSVLPGPAQINPQSGREGVVRGSGKILSLLRTQGLQAVSVRLDRLAKDYPDVQRFRFRLRDKSDRIESREETMSRDAGSAVVLIEPTRYPAGELTLEVLGEPAGTKPEVIGTVELMLVEPARR